MSDIILKESEDFIYIEVGDHFAVHAKKEIISAIVVEANFIILHFIENNVESDMKIPIDEGTNYNVLEEKLTQALKR